MITPGALAKTAGVSKPAISQWLESRVNEGLVAWCNEKGLEFDDISALGKAKNCGEAYIRLISFNFLPTPYRLTGNPRWDKGGDHFNLYYLWLEEDGPVQGINARVCEPAEVLSETRRDRASISDAERMKQQEHPAGLIPLTKDMLDSLMEEFGPLAS